MDVFCEHAVFQDVIGDEVKAPTLVELRVAYDHEEPCKNGSEVKPSQIAKCPEVSWPAEEGALYTLIMTGPDAPKCCKCAGEFKHWVVANIPENNVEKGEELAAYIGCFPPKDTGLHRSVYIVYKQPQRIEFKEPVAKSNQLGGRFKFSAKSFAARYALTPVAGAVFTTQWDKTCSALQNKLIRSVVMEKLHSWRWRIVFGVLAVGGLVSLINAC